MSQTVLDQAFSVSEANGIARFRVVVSGSESGTCQYPESPFNQHPLGVSTHSQNINGKPIGVRSLGVIKCEAAESIAEGDAVVVADATGKIKSAPKASATFGDTPATNEIVVTAKQTGFIGNNIEVELEALTSGNPISVSVTGHKVVVGCVTSDDVTITSTASDIISAINDDVEASLLISAANGASSDGSGTVAAASHVLSSGQAGDYSFAIAQETATADGDLIEILIK